MLTPLTTHNNIMVHQKIRSPRKMDSSSLGTCHHLQQNAINTAQLLSTRLRLWLVRSAVCS